MQWIETSGKDVQEAVESALYQLGISRSELEFTVVAEPRRGLLGLMKAEARIRARVKPTTFKPKETRERRPRSSSRNDSRKSSGAETSSGGRGGARKSTGQSSTSRVARKDAPNKESLDDRESSVDVVKDAKPRARSGSRQETKRTAKPAGSKSISEEKDAKAASTEAPKTDRGRRSRSTDSKLGSKDANKTPQLEEEGSKVTSLEGNETRIEEDSVSLEEQAELAKDFLEGLLDEFDADGEVSIQKTDEDTMLLSVNGDGLGLLIGPKASILTAIQDLTRTVVQRKTGPGQGRIIVDIGGYRAKRKVALEEFSRNVASAVIEAGSEQVLEPMNPADRKVIHDTIGSIEGVATRSEGEEPRRRVVVFPEN